MKCFIVTGTSRGLGEAIIKKILDPNKILFCISRKKNESLIHAANDRKVRLEYIPYDLNNLADIDTVMEGIFQKITGIACDGYYLVNNASILAPIKPIERCSQQEIVENFQVNTLAPILLTASFIRMTQTFNADKRVVNISSKAAKKPCDGWSCYAGSKAAIEMFSQCAALEQEECQYPVKVIAFNPGMMDTNFQKEIRATTKEDFGQVNRFIEAKESGKLQTADYVAEKIITLLFDEAIVHGGAIDIKDR
jgi:benzil reductase ((S)-benzoin forming)